MAQGAENIELYVFCRASFIDAITDVTPVANKLHEKGLIDRHTYSKVTERASGLSQHERATEVLKVLQQTISVVKKPDKRQEKFDQILKVFSEFTPLNHVADEAREEYESSKKDGIRPEETSQTDFHASTSAGQRSLSQDPLSREPHMDQIVKWIVPHISPKWKTFGLMLNVSNLDAIEQDYHRSCKNAAIEMFSVWKKTKCSPYTWTNIVQVLRFQVIGEQRLADEVTEKVLNTF